MQYPDSLQQLVQMLAAEYLERNARAFAELPIERRLSLACSSLCPFDAAWHLGVAADADEILRDLNLGDSVLRRDCAALHLLHLSALLAADVVVTLAEATGERTEASQ